MWRINLPPQKYHHLFFGKPAPFKTVQAPPFQAIPAYILVFRDLPLFMLTFHICHIHGICRSTGGASFGGGNASHKRGIFMGKEGGVGFSLHVILLY